MIGDKKAAQASRILLQAEGMEALKRLEKKLGFQLKFVHVIRNPFDNIATMVLRRADLNKKGQEKLTVRPNMVFSSSLFTSFGILPFDYVRIMVLRVVKARKKR